VVIGEVLRRELGFDGLVLAGPVDAEDLRASLDPAEAARRAIMAGADLVYWRGGLDGAMRGVDRLVRDVADGTLSEARVNAAVERVLRVKFAQRTAAETAPKATKAARLDVNKRLRRDALPIERHAITLVRNTGQATPIGKGSMPIGVTGVIGVEELRKALEKHLKPIAMQEIKTARHVGDIQDFEINRLTQHVSGIRTAIVVVTEEQRLPGVVRLVRGLKGKVPTVILVHLGCPRPELLQCEADAIVLGYANIVNAELTLEAMADVLFGTGPAEALQTDTAFRLRTGEKGMYRALDVVRSPVGRLPVALGPEAPAGFRLNHDPRGAVAKARWEIPALRTGRDWEIEHAFAAPGEYVVTLHVRDRQGVESAGQFNVIVED
jgi:beta-N-acetylhexosaminidase